MARCAMGTMLLLWSLLGALVARSAAKSLAIVTDCALTNSAYSCGALEGVERLRSRYPDVEVNDVAVTTDTCADWVAANASQMHMVIFVGFQFGDCLSAVSNHPNTWFVGIDVCIDAAPNLICGVFTEAEPSYAAGYLAGLVTTTKIAAVVGGAPVPAVKRLFNGFRLGLLASCPDCMLEGIYINSFYHPANSIAVADYLVAAGADVVYGCGGATGSLAIVRAAELGAKVVGVDVDEFESTFGSASAEVMSRVITSVVKKVPVAIEVATSFLIDVPAASSVDGISGGTLLLDYANGAVGLADCHLSCKDLGARAWQKTQAIQLQIASGVLKVELSSDGSLLLPSGMAPNTFLPAFHTGVVPEKRVQHAMAAFSTAWQTHIALFGGLGEIGLLEDLWLYEVESGRWMEGDNPMFQGARPPALSKACMVSLGSSLVVFGGRNKDNSQSNLTYLFTAQPDFLGFGDSTSPEIRYTWSAVAATGSAPAVEAHSCVAMNSSCLAVFGGREAFKQSAEVNQLCLEASSGTAHWTRLWAQDANSGDEAPDAREGAGIAHLPGSTVGLAEAEVLVIIGGTSAGMAKSDAWAFSLSGGIPQWKRLPDLPVALTSPPIDDLLVALKSPPILFASPVANADGTMGDVLVVQLTSALPGLGIGALTLDVDSGEWAAQPAEYSGGVDASHEAAVAVRCLERTWVFGSPGQGLYLAEFALQKACAPGQAAVGVKCAACPAGRVSPGGPGAVCVDCAAGKASQADGLVECDVCPPGRFSGPGHSTCDACPAGQSTQMRLGSASCAECNLGRFSRQGDPTCEACDVGRFADVLGSSECSPCPGDLTTRYLASESDERCLCPEGTYRPVASSLRSRCMTCLEGMRCDFGSDLKDMAASSNGTYPMVRPGYMTLEGEPLKVYACESQVACPGGKAGSCAPFRDVSTVACGSCMVDAYPSGVDCLECSETSIAGPLILAVVAAIAGLALLNYIVSRDLMQQTHSGVNMIVLAGLTMSALQTLGLFAQLSIDWYEPMSSILQACKLVSFDLELLKLPCLLWGGPIASYAYSQCPALVGGALVLFFVLLKHRFRFTIKVGTDFMNAFGSLMNLAFISVVLSCARPWVCYSHPPGSGSSMRSASAILCFEGGDHAQMLVVSVISFFVIPLPFLAFAVYGTYKYPSLASQVTNGGAPLLQALRFLVLKFVPERYYYSIILLARSLLLCSVPVVLRDQGFAQTLAIATILCTFLQVQQQLNPWRLFMTNVADGVLCTTMIILVISTGSSDAGMSSTFVAILGTTVFAFMLIMLLSALAYSVFRRLRQHPYFHDFICHHKAAAAAQARLLKMMLDNKKKDNGTFIDSDHLIDLDTLLDTVKSRVERLIVYLTRDTLTRAWCAGEITTAFKVGGSKVSIWPIYTTSFVAPSERDLSNLDSFIDFSGCNLLQYGIAQPDVQAAFRHLLGDSLPSIKMDSTVWGLARFVHLVNDLFGKTNSKPSSSNVVDDLGTVVISADPHDDEAIATAGILASKIEAQVFRIAAEGVHCLANDDPDDLVRQSRVIARARAFLCVLSHGTLQCLPQLLAIIEAMSMQAAGKCCQKVVPVSTPAFPFPDEKYYSISLPRILQTTPELGAVQIKHFFRMIAVSLSTHKADSVITAQANDVFARIPTTFDRAAAEAAGAGLMTTSEEFRHLLAGAGAAGSADGVKDRWVAEAVYVRW